MCSKELIEVVVSSLSKEGEGIALFNSKKIFIKGALLGERVLVSLYDEHDKYAQGQLEKVLIANPNRTESFCQNPCGACSFTCLSYKAELDIKIKDLNILFDDLSNGKELYSSANVYGMQEPFEYRNKAIYACGLVDGEYVLGLYARNSHDIIRINNCCLEPKWINKVRNSLCKLINNYTDFATKIRYVVFRGTSSTEKLVCFVVSEGTDIPKDIISLLEKDFAISNIVININNTEGNRILGEETKIISGDGSIAINLLDNIYNLDIYSFFQINHSQTEVLYSKAIDLLNPNKQDKVLDLYCGVGSISLSLSKRCQHVYGIECVPEAIENAKKNALANSIDNADFYCGLVEDVLPTLIKDNISISGALLDPSRKGCEQSVFEVLSKVGVNRIVYISCNPTTQHRDILYAKTLGYEIKECLAVDMFPHTRHVETVVLLSREK